MKKLNGVSLRAVDATSVQVEFAPTVPVDARLHVFAVLKERGYSEIVSKSISAQRHIVVVGAKHKPQEGSVLDELADVYHGRTNVEAPKAQPVKLDPKLSDEAASHQLVKALHSRGIKLQASRADEAEFLSSMPSMFDTQEQADAAWNNGFNSFFREVSKPLPGSNDGWGVSREALEYWNRFKLPEGGGTPDDN